MKPFIYALTLCLSLMLWSCTPKAPLSIHWEMGKNDVRPGVCEMYYTLTNHTNQPLTNEGWTLYFNYMSLHPIYTEGDQLIETELQASYHSMAPTADFEPLMPHESRTYKLHYRGNAIRETSRPEGFFLIQDHTSSPLRGRLGGGSPISIPCTYAPFTRPEQMKRGIVTWEKTPYADGEYVYDYVQKVIGDGVSATGKDLQPLLPQPKQIIYTEGTCQEAKA